MAKTKTDELTSFHLRISSKTLRTVKRVSGGKEISATDFIRDAIHEKLERTTRRRVSA